MLIRGIISDVTRREEADARLAEASDRFTRLLDVVGEHVYLAQALPDGSVRELFQGPGADRLLGGAEPDPEMENWDAALHPADRAAYDAFNRALADGQDADVEYRLIGADGITRWVHDRAATRRLPDGAVEISGIVSDVSERRSMRAELDEAHAALSRVVDAMDDHLYTLRIDAGRRLRDRLSRPASLRAGRRHGPRRRRRRSPVGVAGPPRRPRTVARRPSRGWSTPSRSSSSTGSWGWTEPSASSSTASVRAVRRTARCSTTARRATSPSGGGSRTSCASPAARPSCARGPTS